MPTKTPEQHYSIGAAAREVGVSTHVLRKWESRNNLIKPERSQNGRRTYSAEQIQSLRSIKSLTSSGVSLSQLTDLTTNQLADLEQQLRDTSTKTISVVGSPFFSDKISNDSTHSFQVVADTLDEWLNTPTQDSDITIIDVPTLDSETLSKLTSYQEKQTTSLTVIYRYSQPNILQRALSSGIRVYRGPVSVTLARDLFNSSRETDKSGAAPELLPVTPPRISPAEVRRVGALSNSVACECPAHVADLLSSLNAFEKYSLECISKQPDDAKMHQYLHQTTANARTLFETALERLAAHEGIELHLV